MSGMEHFFVPFSITILQHPRFLQDPTPIANRTAGIPFPVAMIFGVPPATRPARCFGWTGSPVDRPARRVIESIGQFPVLSAGRPWSSATSMYSWLSSTGRARRCRSLATAWASPAASTRYRMVREFILFDLTPSARPSPSKAWSVSTMAVVPSTGTGPPPAHLYHATNAISATVKPTMDT